ncbi:MAG TPA: hypothetical protein DDW26_05215, partial [Rhizobiales bacterium]|nr:hypothetical protein [Hyphomicrobiales bacterium]
MAPAARLITEVLMRHHAIAAAMGLVTAAFLAPCSQSQAASADPTGYWYKPDAERESKIQVFKCGKAKSQLCAKIIWLKDPNDSKGKALHDVRNEDPSMRDRPIVGLTIFSGLAPSAPDTWTGQIYNPEDGHIYAATLTMVSRKEINLKGCKAWLLCGEKEWLRTTAPQELTPAIPAATPQIEASAAPSVPSGAAAPAAPASPSTAEASASAAPSAEAAAAPGPQTVREASAEPQSTSAEPQPVALPKAELATPAAPPAEQDTRPGYGFLNASTAPETTARVSGENVSSMFDMTKPIAAGSVAPVPAAATPIAATAAADPSSAQTGTQAAGQADAGVPLPTQKPKAKTIATASAKPAAKTVTSTSAKPAEQAAP